MEKIERIGVSVEKELLKGFDKLISQQGYQNRSEAIRDLIRIELSKKSLANPSAKAIAAVCFVYNHHSGELQKKLTSLQHNNLLHVICSTHIHLDEHDCMEIIILKGQAGHIKTTAENILSQKGVKLGNINLFPADD